MFRSLLDRAQTPSKKPKVWSIAVLSVLFAAALAVLLTRPEPSLQAVSALIAVYLALDIVLLLRAFLGQLRYNPYSYNTLYYIGFALYLLAALITQFYLMGMFRGRRSPPQRGSPPCWPPCWTPPSALCSSPPPSSCSTPWPCACPTSP